jgi:hypothetical protein
MVGVPPQEQHCKFENNISVFSNNVHALRVQPLQIIAYLKKSRKRKILMGKKK